jgi:pectin methylesterase-like acyl-CoA thioesterase
MSVRCVAGLCAFAFAIGDGRASPQTIDVPGDVPTIAAAVAAASPGDTILIEPGTYRPSVTVRAAKHDLTIRGVDRNTVVFDGGGRLRDAIDVEADRVTVENLSAHSYLGTVFYWDHVSGFQARYLTV